VDSWWVYIIDKNGKMYVGITTDLTNRLKQHGNPELLYKEGPLAHWHGNKRSPERNKSKDGGGRKNWNSLLKGQESRGELALLRLTQDKFVKRRKSCPGSHY